jgi:hypothetical protein
MRYNPIHLAALATEHCEPLFGDVMHGIEEKMIAWMAVVHEVVSLRHLG